MAPRLCEIERDIRTGDPLFWRPHDAEGEAIARVSGSAYCHVGIACWMQVVHGRFAKPKLYSLDMIRGTGGVMVPLSRYVEQFPGLLDVYHADPGGRYRDTWNPRGCCQYWLDNFLGLSYGDKSARAAAWTAIPVLRWLFQPSRDDSDVSGEPPFCSESVATAEQRGGGMDSVLQLAPRSTWPGHLAQTPFHRITHEGVVP